MNVDLGGKTVVLTGGASGIGRAVLSRLSELQARTIVVDRAPSDAGPREAEYLPCDLSDRASVEELCRRLPDGLDALVSVAGVSGATGPRDALVVNYLAPRYLIDELAPRVRPGGAVVTVASTAGANWRRHLEALRGIAAVSDWDEALRLFDGLGASADGLTGTEAYDLSKEAIVYYSQVAASTHFRERGVRVNTVSPGPISTPLLREFHRTMGSDAIGRLRDATGREGRPEEVAGAVMFLLGQDASWVNGADLHVDGGAEAAFHTGVITASRTGSELAD